MGQQSWKRELEKKQKEQEDADGVQKPKAKGRPKAKAKGKAKAKSSAKAKASPKKKVKSPKVTQKTGRKKRSTQEESEVTPPQVSEVVTESDSKRKKMDQRVTFARRYRPKTPWGGAQWDALNAAFVGIIAVQSTKPLAKLEAIFSKNKSKQNQ